MRFAENFLTWKLRKNFHVASLSFASRLVKHNHTQKPLCRDSRIDRNIERETKETRSRENDPETEMQDRYQGTRDFAIILPIL